VTKISIDGSAHHIDAQAGKKLGEILEDVMTSMSPARVVTEITVDGKSLRGLLHQPDCYESNCDSVNDIEIQTVDRAIWAESGIDMALSSLERVKTSLVKVAELFRGGSNIKANDYFVRCVEGLERFIETMMTTRGILELDFTKISHDGLSLAKMESELCQILQSIVHQQENAEYEAIADQLEDELAPNLAFWVRALKQLRLTQSSNA